ncbi:MAG TPA: heme biosynthesis HemY N-terminal domain-containing protein [Pseudolabrys sp.]|jgi:HemY protein|nr:heme biosynthesis HemY N-terminal domain-containing protein [Pseudolabrys sp.]
MIRIVLFLASLAVIAAGVGWIADRPGEVSVTWMGHRVETSLMVAFFAVVALVVVLMLVWWIISIILHSPGYASLFFRHRRAAKGYLAVTRGLIAIGAGDLRAARKAADEAARLSPRDPLALLLGAQSAQLAGDRSGAERAFRAMTAREDTRALGLRGLYIEAQRRNDLEAARRAAEEAAKLRPPVAWAGQAVLEYRCAASDWAGALEALDHMKGALAKPDYRRKRAVLLAARAHALEDTDRDASRALVLESVKLAPDLVPAAALAGRRLAEAGDTRKARKILEAAWAINPHPDLAESYADLRLGDSARERLARMQKLAGKVPGQLEGALAVARAALDAREFATARSALASHLSTPTRRVATLMAEIEEAEHGDEGRVREWMMRAMRASGDPVWTADGTVSDRWLPVSPNGRLDGFEWKVPLAQIGVARPVIEVSPPIAETVPVPSESKAEPPPEPEPEKPRKIAKPKPTAKAKPVEPVIPLVHAPDDPGLDSGLDRDPVPETSTPPASDAWQRLRQLFR